jgi:hypothetical protein
MTKRVFVIIGLLLICGGVLGYAYASPWLTVSKVRKAAQTGDVETVNAHVDFPSLRESFKASLNAHMAREFTKPETRDNPFALFGLALVSKLGEVFVDAMVTPESVRMMLEGQRPTPQAAGESPLPASSARSAASDSDTDTLMAYESRDRFLVTYRKKADPSDTFTLVWPRSGLAD